VSDRLDALQQKIIELQEELASLRRSEYIARAGTARALDTQFPDALLHLPFDGGVPYETDYSVNLAGHKLQFPSVATGGIIGRPGKFGKAVQIAEGTTNLVTNPSFEVDTAGWTGLPGGILTRVTEHAKYGSACLELEAVALYGGARTTFPVSNGVTYTASMWLRSDEAGAKCDVQVYTGSGGIARLNNIPLTTEWQRVSLTFTATSTWTYEVRTFTATGALEPQTWQVDGVQVEAKSYPTPYCDGSLGPGHAWTGTPHASASTRVAAHLGYGPQPGVDGPRGCYAFWFMPFANSGTWPTNTRLVQAGNGSSAILCRLLR